MSPRALMVAAALASATAGCETIQASTCDFNAADNPPVPYTQGTVTDGVYMSTPLDPPEVCPTSEPTCKELLYYPGGMRYDLVVHGLAAPPAQVDVLLSFDEYGRLDGGGLAPAAGNQAEWVVGPCNAALCQPGDSMITVGNDSCSEYWLLVTASP